MSKINEIKKINKLFELAERHNEVWRSIPTNLRYPSLEDKINELLELGEQSNKVWRELEI